MDLESRVHELEQELGQLRTRWQKSQRRLVWAAIGGILFTLGTVWMIGGPVHAQQGNRAGPVQATSFTLVDDQGGKHMDIAASKTGALITFYQNDKSRLVLGTKNGNPGMLLINNSGKVLEMYSKPKETLLSLFDGDGKSRVILSQTPEKTGVTVKDSTGKDIWGTP